MNHIQQLDHAKSIVAERAQTYGGVENCFERIAEIASLILDVRITPHMVSMILVAVKLGRLAESPTHADSYTDAINYLAFSAEFSAANREPDRRLPPATVPSVFTDAVANAMRSDV